nr:hypothetical protein CFP56_53833 [Quercus suber]
MLTWHLSGLTTDLKLFQTDRAVLRLLRRHCHTRHGLPASCHGSQMERESFANSEKKKKDCVGFRTCPKWLLSGFFLQSNVTEAFSKHFGLGRYIVHRWRNLSFSWTKQKCEKSAVLQSDTMIFKWAKFL